MVKKVFSLAFVFGWIVLYGALSAQAASLTYTTSTPMVEVGHSIQVALQIAGLGNRSAPSLGTFDVTTLFSPTGVLNFPSTDVATDVAFGNQLNLGSGSLTSVTDLPSLPGTRVVNILEVSLASPQMLDTQQPGAFPLATFTLNALSPGVADIRLLAGTLGDALGNPLPLDRVTNATVTVTPEPGTFALLGTFLALGLWFTWRLRRQAA